MRLSPIAACTALLATLSRGQTTFAEIEPHGEKSEATSVVCLDDGDVLTGTTTGSLVALGVGTSPTADTFRVRTCTSAPGLHRRTLTLTSASPGHTATLRGLVQSGIPGVGGTATTIDATVATSTGTGAAPRVVSWYGSVGGEELYYRVGGGATTTQAYFATLSTSAVVPTTTGPFVAGSITISTEGQGHATDTDLWLYDANFAPIALAGNDDVYVSTSVQSRLVRTLAPGTYHLALSVFNLANEQMSPADEDFVQGNLCDFAGMTASSSTLQNVDVSFAISDAGHTVPVSASVGVGEAHSVAWFRFEVLPPLFESYCPGDGTQPQPGPCANSGASGRGCANSVNAQGAQLTATGTTNPDTVVLHASGMPSLAYCLFLKGDAQTTGVLFGDGVRCVDGALIRLRLKLSNAGAAAFPEVGDPLLSVRGATPPGSATIGYYQTYYRNAAASFCPPETFNVTNGWRIVW
ncbi:MAG: hypothetical protein HZA53_06150 [Planctomycetes bacterium]|nr:hypothetical protein [Planctomycetota bacterium]